MITVWSKSNKKKNNSLLTDSSLSGRVSSNDNNRNCSPYSRLQIKNMRKWAKRVSEPANRSIVKRSIKDQVSKMSGVREWEEWVLQVNKHSDQPRDLFKTQLPASRNMSRVPPWTKNQSVLATWEQGLMLLCWLTNDDNLVGRPGVKCESRSMTKTWWGYQVWTKINDLSNGSGRKNGMQLTNGSD